MMLTNSFMNMAMARTFAQSSRGRANVAGLAALRIGHGLGGVAQDIAFLVAFIELRSAVYI